MDTLLVSRPACAAVHERDAQGCSYRIAWSINPHMRVDSADPIRARAQHARFVTTLRRSCAQVLRLPFVHGAYDSVFLKDSVVLTEHAGELEALIASPAHPVRLAEQGARAAQLRRLGFKVTGPLASPLEGGDVIVPASGGFALLGHGFRSSRDSSAGLAQFLRREVITLELCDPSLYHLDTALVVLSNNTAVICEQAFTTPALQTMFRLPFAEIRVVSPAQARRFALNVVELGDTVVTGTDSADMALLWGSLGRRQVVAHVDEFQLAGGSAACLVGRIHRLQRART